MKTVRLDPKKAYRFTLCEESTRIPRERRGTFMLAKLGRRLDSEIPMSRRVMAEAVADVLDTDLSISLAATGWGVWAKDLATNVAYARVVESLDSGADLERETEHFGRMYHVDFSALTAMLLEEMAEPGEEWADLVATCRVPPAQRKAVRS